MKLLLRRKKVIQSHFHKVRPEKELDRTRRRSTVGTVTETGAIVWNSGGKKLWISCWEGNFDTVKFYVDHGATINWVPTKKDLNPKKSIFADLNCFSSGRVHDEQTYIFKNSDLSVCPLSIAIKSQNNEEKEKIIHYLLDNGANPNLPDHSGIAPIHVACYHLEKPSNILFDLVSHGANTNQLDCYGNSPMHVILLNMYHAKRPACTSEKLESVKAIRHLVSGGANPNSQNSHGLTPSDLVNSNKYIDQFDKLEICELLQGKRRKRIESLKMEHILEKTRDWAPETAL